MNSGRLLTLTYILVPGPSERHAHFTRHHGRDRPQFTTIHFPRQQKVTRSTYHTMFESLFFIRTIALCATLYIHTPLAHISRRELSTSSSTQHFNLRSSAFNPLAHQLKQAYTRLSTKTSQAAHPAFSSVYSISHPFSPLSTWHRE